MIQALAGLPAGLRISLLGSLWGSAFLFIHISLDKLSPFEVAAGRLLVAAPILGLTAWLVGGIPAYLALRTVRYEILVGLGVLNCAIPFFLVAYAQRYVPSGVAAIFNAATPLLTVMLAVATGIERRPGLLRLLGIVLGLLGIATMFGFAAGEGPLWARLALLGAAASFAAGFVLARKSELRRVDGITLATAQVTIGLFILAVPTLALSMGSLPAIGTDSAAGLLALGAISTAFPYFIYFELVRDVGPSASALATYLVPIVGVLLGWVFLGERVALTALAGALMVIGGVALAQRFNSLATEEV